MLGGDDDDDDNNGNDDDNDNQCKTLLYMTGFQLKHTLNLLANELSIVTSLCPSSRTLKPVDQGMERRHFSVTW